MSKGDATAKPRNALPDARVEDGLLVDQVRALLVGRAEFSSVFLGAERGRFAVDAICMGAGRDGSTLQQAYGHGGRNLAGTKLAYDKVWIVLRALGIDRPENYKNWRQSTRADVACCLSLSPVEMKHPK